MRPTRDPLSGVTRLLVDATNVLHALSRGADRQPPAALIGRLRGAIPPEVSIELVFDGPAERGLSGERIASGLSVRYGGRFSADTILITLAEEAAESRAADSVLVVSDDVALRSAVQRRGARTAGTAWLLRRLDQPRVTAPVVGNRRPPIVAQPSPAEQPDDAGSGRRWAPGRGATRKRGNPRRPAKGS